MSDDETITREELAAYGQRNRYVDDWAERVIHDIEAHRGPGSDEGESPDLPNGIWARVEMPGYRENTGWVTGETSFGTQVAVVRNWDGGIEAEVVLGPGCRVVCLPAPLRRPEPRVALPAGGLGGEYGDDDDELEGLPS